MNITKDTSLCISIAARPGNFGTRWFNRAFATLGLDYLYKAMALAPDGDLEGVIRAVRALGFKGCGVSMPFKERIMPLLDAWDHTAKRVGAANTIVNSNGHLVGYNTDYLAATAICAQLGDLRGKRAVVCGMGGVARAIVTALHDAGANVLVAGRDASKQARFLQQVSGEAIAWGDLTRVHGFLFVNATPVGMVPHGEDALVGADVLKKFSAVFDVVVDPSETVLIRTARALGLTAIPGVTMTIEQAIRQFELYTGVTFPRQRMAEWCLEDSV